MVPPQLTSWTDPAGGWFCSFVALDVLLCVEGVALHHSLPHPGHISALTNIPCAMLVCLASSLSLAYLSLLGLFLPLLLLSFFYNSHSSTLLSRTTLSPALDQIRVYYLIVEHAPGTDS